MDLARTATGFELDLGSSADVARMVVVGLLAAAVGAAAPLFLAALLLGTRTPIPQAVIAGCLALGAVCGAVGALSLWTRRRVVADGDMLVVEERHLLSPTDRHRYSLAGLEDAEVVPVTLGEGTDTVTQHVIRLHFPHSALVKTADVWLPLDTSRLGELAQELVRLRAAPPKG